MEDGRPGFVVIGDPKLTSVENGVKYYAYRLDDSHLALNNQAILDEPFCLGARVRDLVQTPGPWRYDIVDTKSQKIIVSITKGE